MTRVHCPYRALVIAHVLSVLVFQPNHLLQAETSCEQTHDVPSPIAAAVGDISSTEPMVKERQAAVGVPRRGNCVDACVLEFLSRHGHPLTESEFDAGLDYLGLDKSAASRSLADCVEILRYFGEDTIALPFTVTKEADYPPLAIFYVPPERPGRIGHVLLIEDIGVKRVKVWDPSSKELTRIVHLDQLKVSQKTLILVRRSHLQSSYAKVLIITFLIAILFLLLGPTVMRRVRRASRAVAIGMLMPFVALLSGCTGNSVEQSAVPASSVEVRPLIHDFGQLDPRATQPFAVKSFTVFNRGSTPVFCRVHTDCSCIVTEPGSSTFNVLPGDKASFDIRVSLERKAGDFEQNVLVSVTESLDAAPREVRTHETPDKTTKFYIRLAGFVQRQPLPVRSPVRLRALDGHMSADVVRITHARTTDRDALMLVGVRLSHDESDPASGSPSLAPADLETRLAGPFRSTEQSRQSDEGFFELGEARFVAGNNAATTCVDLWEIPITFTAKRRGSPFGSVLATRTLVVRWRDRNAAEELETRCEVVGELMSPLEMPERFLVGEAAIGSELRASIPIRFNTLERLDEFKVVCPRQIRAQLDGVANSLIVRISEEELGVFNHSVRVLLDDDEIADVEVVGQITSQATDTTDASDGVN